jgi:hypothetical protein
MPKIVGFLQLTAELLIGAEDRYVHCPSCAQAPLLYELERKTSHLFERHAPGHESLYPVLSTHRQKPSSLLLPIASGKGAPPTTSEPLKEAHLDPERNRRWAELCESVKQKGAFADLWFHHGTRVPTYAAET